MAVKQASSIAHYRLNQIYYRFTDCQKNEAEFGGVAYYLFNGFTDLNKIVSSRFRANGFTHCRQEEYLPASG